MNATELYKLGKAKVSENELELAIELFTKAIDLDSTNPFIFNERAVCYLNLEQFELSLFDMNKSIEIDPNYAYFYSSRAFLKIRMRDMESGIADYEKSLELDPKNDITYNNLGLALEQMGNVKRAERVFADGNKVLGYDPKKRLPENETNAKSSESVPAKEPEPTKAQSKAGVAKAVFTKKSSFKEFLGFIKNGFKLKENDKN